MRTKMKWWRAMVWGAGLAVVQAAAAAIPSPAPDASAKHIGYHYPTLKEVGNADRDILGEAALAQPGGPSYEFLKDAMPPLRYVDANFHVYPVPLSAPANLTKARWVSNGSAVNALARQPDWHGETGIPMTFYVGEQREMFGADLSRTYGPTYASGYLPIVQIYFVSQGSVFREEAFCSVNPQLADHGVVFVKFTLIKSDGHKHGGLFSTPSPGTLGEDWGGSNLELRTQNLELNSPHPSPPLEYKGREQETAPVAGVESAANVALKAKVYNAKIEAQIEGYDPLIAKDGMVLTKDGKALVAMYPQWAINPGRGAIIAPLKVGESAYLAICTTPMDPKLLGPITKIIYDQERNACALAWNEYLRDGMVVDVPEPLVNNVWRALLIGNQELRVGDAMHYSAGNQYSKIYIGEGGDAVVATALWGHLDDAQHEMLPQFHYTRKGLEFHQAGLKLQMLAKYYLLTRDAGFVRSIRPLWEKELNTILNGREKSTGMLPREKYCGDIATMVYSLNSNSNCWRALRDMSVVLADIGENSRAADLAKTAAEYRKIILAAIDHAKQRDVNPPFVPIALSGEETPHDPIWATTIGSYWNLMIEYVLGSGVFPPDSETATQVVQYLRAKGGLCMGMLRARSDELNFWMDGPRINDLYGMRYALLMDQRDEPERAILGFYGKLAQGMTRGTFIDCEGSSMVPVDKFGRQMYLPPNSAGNASFLQQLRYLLIQDYDTNDDGKPDMLRLLFATPRAWLEDGKTISVQSAPTAFGVLALTVQSEVAHGSVTADINLPGKAPNKIYLRLRLPEGHRVLSASVGAQARKINGETVDLSGLSGHVQVEAKISQSN